MPILSNSKYILVTLIGASGMLGADHVAEVTGYIAQHQGTVIAQDWLSPFEACDLTVEMEGADEGGEDGATWLRNFIQPFVHARKLDVIVQADVGMARRKKLLFADMESTIIKEEMLEELAAQVGLRDKVQEITQRAMNGELDFRAALQERLALLKGLPTSVLDELSAKMTVMGGARELVATMRAQGSHCVLVSGGFRVFTGKIARELGFHAEHGNELALADGKIAGVLAEPVLDKNGKLAILKETTAGQGLNIADALAVGDGANDIPMLLEAGIGIAYHAKPAVLEQAKHCLRFADLRGLLWAQGYRAGEIRQ